MAGRDHKRGHSKLFDWLSSSFSFLPSPLFLYPTRSDRLTRSRLSLHSVGVGHRHQLVVLAHHNLSEGRDAVKGFVRNDSLKSAESTVVTIDLPHSPRMALQGIEMISRKDHQRQFEMTKSLHRSVPRPCNVQRKTHRPIANFTQSSSRNVLPESSCRPYHVT